MPKKAESATRPALTPEGKENQLISLAVDLAEKKLRDGTASSQLITHYLKLASSREKLEQEILVKQKDLLDAKKKSLESSQRMEEIYSDALKAMKQYQGSDDNGEQDDK